MMKNIFLLVVFVCVLFIQGYAINMPTVVVMLGAPGAGKGSQAIQLSEKFNIPHISTGDLFRENIKNNTPLGQKAKTFMDQGKLVPDDIVIDMLFDRISHQDCQRGYILDGFPRTLPQAQALQKRLGNTVQMVVLNIVVPDDMIVERITGRIVCPSCGATYHVKFAPSKVQDVCDKCHNTLIHRKDDTEDIVRERLRVYHEQTMPLENYYAEQKYLYNEDGKKAIDEIFIDLCNKLQSLFK